VGGPGRFESRRRDDLSGKRAARAAANSGAIDSGAVLAQGYARYAACRREMESIMAFDRGFACLRGNPDPIVVCSVRVGAAPHQNYRYADAHRGVRSPGCNSHPSGSPTLSQGSRYSKVLIAQKGSRLIKVPLLDLKAEYAGLHDEILPALDRVCQNSSFVQGEEVGAFERKYADFCGTRRCLALSTGTAALHRGLLALGLQRKLPAR
jgi:DegT/DnrJ/EryC1/StrS aminotransferase family